MMLCPLKFSRYEFEGGETCIGAECGFYGGVCRGVGHTAMKDAHSKAQSKDAPTLSEQPELLSDSREKLEAEILDAGCADEIDYDRIIGWLDRQAAITERKHLELACAFQLESDKRITELQAKVDELTEQLEAAHEKNRALKVHIGKMQDGRHGWHVKGVELQRQVDELTEERDRYRDMCSRLLNLAQEIEVVRGVMEL